MVKEATEKNNFEMFFFCILENAQILENFQCFMVHRFFVFDSKPKR